MNRVVGWHFGIGLDQIPLLQFNVEGPLSLYVPIGSWHRADIELLCGIVVLNS